VKIASALLLAAAVAQERAPRPSEVPLPQSVAPQPVAFSHRVHAEKAGLACEFCHAEAARGDAATLPRAETCLACHRSIKRDAPDIAKLLDAVEKGVELAWVRVYRVPDFVFFGHAPHVAAGLSCSLCHGPVATRDVLQKEVSTSMNACLYCHRRQGAPEHCAACHQLGH
jgi:Cytochrome c7 and related cytochrome c